MKKMMIPALALLMAFGACKKAEDKSTEVSVTDTTAVKDETPAEAAKPMDSAAMAKAWNEYMTPGDNHKMLAAEAGSWTTETSMWMDPSAPPEKSSGTADVQMVYGGRYQQCKMKGTVMGQPFEGTAMVGYNNASKKFESTWSDNMSTGMMFSTGTYDEASKTINFDGKCVDPMTGQEKTYREVWTIVDEKTRKMEMFDKDPAGKEYKSMEMTMKRK